MKAGFQKELYINMNKFIRIKIALTTYLMLLVKRWKNVFL